MKKPLPDGSMEGPGGLKAFAKELVSQYYLGEDAARFAVVSFAADATTRVPWSHNAAEINAGIDQMSADGPTSISDGLDAARQLFADDSRPGATKIVLLVSDGEQTVDAAPFKTPEQTAIDASALVKGDGATVFAWGFGNKVSLAATLEQIATATRPRRSSYKRLASSRTVSCCLRPPSAMSLRRRRRRRRWILSWCSMRAAR